jgi:nucleoside-diphosphate-sugar epimerase
MVSRIAREEAAEIRVLDRSAGRLLDLDGEAVAIHGDVTDPGAVAAAVEGVDYVFHTAAVLDGDTGAQCRVNVEGSRTVAVESARAGVRRLVHVSSNAVYGFCEGVVDEDMGPKPTGQTYAISKAEGEEAVRLVGLREGLGYTIVRPSAIFGPGAEYFTKTFMKRALKRPIIQVGRGSGDQAVIYVDDVADLCAVAATHPAAEGEAFNCAIDPPPTMKEYLHAYGTLIGNTSWLGFPMPVVQAASWVVVPFAKRGTYARQLPQNLRQVGRYVVYSGAKARDLLGWEPAYDVERGVRASIPWLRAEGVLDGVALAVPEEA